MIKLFRNTYYNLISLCLLVSCGIQEINQPDIKFDFDGSIKNENYQLKGKGFAYNKGIDGQALVLNSNTGYNSLELNNLSLDGTKDFSIQFWIKTTSDNPTVFSKRILIIKVSYQKWDGHYIVQMEHLVEYWIWKEKN